MCKVFGLPIAFAMVTTGGVQLFVGVEMDANDDQAAAAQITCFVPSLGRRTMWSPTYTSGSPNGTLDYFQLLFQDSTKCKEVSNNAFELEIAI